ncbi:MAG: hypothetical protein HYW48_11615 [Deltaproteobacteria bacterium]|nr:hypothetical protein [Deltaproteobacteria bacterium]
MGKNFYESVIPLLRVCHPAFTSLSSRFYESVIPLLRVCHPAFTSLSSRGLTAGSNLFEEGCPFGSRGQAAG